MNQLFLEEYNSDISSIIVTMISFSEKARREGLLALEDDVNDLSNSFLRKGIQLVVDGTDPELVRNIMTIEMESSTRYMDYNWTIWKEFLLYLTIENPREDELKDYLETFLYSPEKYRKEMKSFLLEFYNEYQNYKAKRVWNSDLMEHPLLGANLKALPFYKYDRFINILKNQYDFYSNQIKRVFFIMIEGTLSIQSGDNPRIVKEKLESYLNEGERDALSEDGASNEDNESYELDNEEGDN